MICSQFKQIISVSTLNLKDVHESEILAGRFHKVAGVSIVNVGGSRLQ